MLPSLGCDWRSNPASTLHMRTCYWRTMPVRAYLAPVLLTLFLTAPTCLVCAARCFGTALAEARAVGVESARYVGAHSGRLAAYVMALAHRGGSSDCCGRAWSVAHLAACLLRVYSLCADVKSGGRARLVGRAQPRTFAACAHSLLRRCQGAVAGSSAHASRRARPSHRCEMSDDASPGPLAVAVRVCASHGGHAGTRQCENKAYRGRSLFID